MYVLLAVLAVITTILGTWHFKRERYIRKCLEKFPGPKTLPFLGSILKYSIEKGLLSNLIDIVQKYGTIVNGQLGPVLHILLFGNAKLAKLVFLGNINLSKGSGYEYTRSWLGEGLLTSDEKKWRMQRKMLAPAFCNQNIISFLKVFNRQSDILVQKLATNLPINSLDLLPFVSMCSLDIISETTMGISLDAQQSQNMDYVNSIKGMCRIIADRSASIWKQFSLLYLFSSDFRLERKYLKIINAYTEKVIAERKYHRKFIRNNEIEQRNQYNEKKTKNALIDILLNYSEEERMLSEQEVKQEVHTFLFAGHDTVSTAVSFLLFEIAKYPDIQNRIYEEQLIIFGIGIDRDVSLEDILAMKYLEMVIKETLRVYPPVPINTRMVTEEFSYDGKTIPTGVTLVHSAYILHRNENAFPNPEVFDPSRFETIDEIKSQHYLPFSAGPRNCIGQKFAMYEMKVMLSKLLRQFKFSVSEPVHIPHLRAEVVLYSRNGLKTRIELRK